MGPPGARPVVFDTGALIAVERGDLRVLALLEEADAVHVPAGVVAQAWRDPVRQVRLIRMLHSDRTTIHDLTEDSAKAAGRLCGQAGASDVVDASVMVLARELGAAVLTGDPDGLRRLAPEIPIVAI